MKISSLGPFSAGEVYTEGQELAKARKEIQKKLSGEVKASQASADSKQEFDQKVHPIDLDEARKRRQKKKRKFAKGRVKAKKLNGLKAYHKTLCFEQDRRQIGSVVDRRI